MSKGHVERLLLADLDYEAARAFRSIAEELVRLRERAVELYTAVDSEPPAAAVMALQSARFECKQLDRVCLRHAARELDTALRSEGLDSDMESATILWDISNPLLAA